MHFPGTPTPKNSLIEDRKRPRRLTLGRLFTLVFQLICLYVFDLILIDPWIRGLPFFNSFQTIQWVWGCGIERAGPSSVLYPIVGYAVVQTHRRLPVCMKILSLSNCLSFSNDSNCANDTSNDSIFNALNLNICSDLGTVQIGLCARDCD